MSSHFYENPKVMKTDFQFIEIPIDEALKTYTLEQLKILSSKFNWLMQATIYFKFEQRKPDRGSICEIKIASFGPSISAKSNQRDYETAVELTIHDLESQLTKRMSVLHSR